MRPPRKVHVGKNERGWYVALPKWWGGYDVVDDLPSWEQAMAVAGRFTFAMRFVS